MTTPSFSQANTDLTAAVTDLESQNAALKAQLAVSVEARDDAALLLAAEAIEVHVTSIRAALSALQGPPTAVTLGGGAAAVGEVVNTGDVPVPTAVPAVGGTVQSDLTAPPAAEPKPAEPTPAPVVDPKPADPVVAPADPAASPKPSGPTPSASSGAGAA